MVETFAVVTCNGKYEANQPALRVKWPTENTGYCIQFEPDPKLPGPSVLNFYGISGTVYFSCGKRHSCTFCMFIEVIINKN